MRMIRGGWAAVLAAGWVMATVSAAGAQQAPPPQPPAVIRITAQGEARATPDRAWLDFGVETEGATAAAAGQQNAQRMDAVVAALARAGVRAEQVQTHDYNVYPDYAQTPEGGQPRIRAYRVSNVVTVRTDEVRGVGQLIDAALAAGANRVNGVRFGLRDPARAQAEALRDAVRGARSQADALAQALGVQVGDVLEVSTGYAPVQPMPMERLAMSDVRAQAATPVEPGQQTVGATVTVIYRIQR